MKTYAKPTPPGTAKFEPIGAVRYLDDEDAFEVEFDSGETYRVTHDAIRRTNGLSEHGEVESVWIEAEVRSGFLVRYRNGEFAECGWGFVKEVT
jgi:hypothetical protein